MMKKKALITTAAAVALVAVVGIGSTLAYFTDSESRTNTVTFGHVDIDFDEPNYDPGDDDDIIENLVPGAEIRKDPTITAVAGSEAMYIRAKIEYKVLNSKGEELDLTDAEVAKVWNAAKFQQLENQIVRVTEWGEGEDGEKIPVKSEALIESAAWVKSADGYYYYQPKVEKSKKDQPIVFFDYVTIPAVWQNEVADMSIQLIVSAEAIQADSFNPHTTDGKIDGWFYSDGKTPVKAETYEAETKLPVAEQGEGRPE